MRVPRNFCDQERAKPLAIVAPNNLRCCSPMLKERPMPHGKQKIQRLCLEAVLECGPDARKIIDFVEARISEMNDDDRRELERDVQLLLSFEPADRPLQ
jgi:hypothetical protein